MKVKNKSELKEIAKGIFERYPKAQNVACTSDGTAFITDEGSHAVKNHAVKNQYGRKLSITEFIRDEMETKETPADEGISAKDLIVKIDAATEAAELELILDAEKEGKNRVTVIEAAAGKLLSLKGGE